MILGFSFINCGIFVQADYQSLLTKLQSFGINTTEISQQAGISRFDMARLLNAIECEDCIIAPPWMQQTYTSQYWDVFTALPSKDFKDIFYLGAPWKKRSYYYCVAFVGDKNYMQGYPEATSLICNGGFCGQNTTTKSEFFQTILNIIQSKIRKKYEADWGAIQTWLSKLAPNSYQQQVLNATDITTIKTQSATKKVISDEKQRQAYLKYCMFNLKACGFQAVQELGQGAWPISEVNILLREKAITTNQLNNIY